MRALKGASAGLVVILLAVAGLTAGGYWNKEVSASAPQDVSSLDRRINQLEQRFYTIETSLVRLEQQVSLAGRPTVTQPTERDTELSLLRAQVEMLSRRLGEIECGLSKLDERTLAPSAREARRQSAPAATGADPCRLNPETPLRLSNRP